MGCPKRRYNTLRNLKVESEMIVKLYFLQCLVEYRLQTLQKLINLPKKRIEIFLSNGLIRADLNLPFNIIIQICLRYLIVSIHFK